MRKHPRNLRSVRASKPENGRRQSKTPVSNPNKNRVRARAGASIKIVNKYNSLRDFLAQLEMLGELKRIAVEVDPKLEMTEICDRVLKADGPALLFEKPRSHAMPVLANLFGSVKRVALAMGAAPDDDPFARLREIGETLAQLKE